MASWFAGVRSTLFGPGMLYCIASLVLGIELNLVGPTASSLSEQVGATEAALGPGENRCATPLQHPRTTVAQPP